jgi:hypothetical protein
MNSVAKREAPRLIQGVILKCVDGRWEDRDGLTPPDKLLAMGMLRCLQCWKDQEPVDTIIETPDEPLPDPADLNSQIPEAEWQPGLDGKPRPPWQLNWIVYLINPTTGDTWTFINSTTGARIAWERLKDKFGWMRALRGPAIVPVIKLDSKPMKTSFGVKMRPEFTIIEWRDVSGEGGSVVPQLEHKSDGGDDGAAVKPDTKPAAASSAAHERAAKSAYAPKEVGRKVKPPTVAEELNDEIPDFSKKKIA